MDMVFIEKYVKVWIQVVKSYRLWMLIQRKTKIYRSGLSETKFAWWIIVIIIICDHISILDIIIILATFFINSYVVFYYDTKEYIP